MFGNCISDMRVLTIMHYALNKQISSLCQPKNGYNCIYY